MASTTSAEEGSPKKGSMLLDMRSVGETLTVALGFGVNVNSVGANVGAWSW